MSESCESGMINEGETRTEFIGIGDGEQYLDDREGS